MPLLNPAHAQYMKYKYPNCSNYGLCIYAFNTGTAPRIRSQHQYLLLVVSVYVAHAQIASSVAMLELSIILSSSLLIEAHMCCTKLLSKVVLRNIFRLLFMCVMRLKFTKCTCIILMHWHVILVTRKMSH